LKENLNRDALGIFDTKLAAMDPQFQDAGASELVLDADLIILLKAGKRRSFGDSPLLDLAWPGVPRAVFH